MLVGRFEIRPFYAQIELSDERSTDYPQFQTGFEPAGATPDCIVVHTRGDMEGPVPVEVWTERVEAENVTLKLVYQGDLTVTHGAVVGNTGGNQLIPLPIPVGKYGVKVFAPVGDGFPGAVYFLIAPAGDL